MPRRKTQSDRIDYMLLASVVALLVYGLVILYSATFSLSATNYLGRQLMWVAIGLLGIGILLKVNYLYLRLLALPAMLGMLVLLTAGLLLGDYVLGARRTLIEDSVQPGVLARLITVIYIAAWLSSRGEQLNKFTYGLIPFSAIIGIVAMFVVLQPDLSTALLIVLTGLMMFFFAGGDPAQIGLAILIGAPAGLAMGWLIAPERLQGFVAGLKDPDQMVYQLWMAIRAIGSGGIIGTGIGAGRVKYGYLPAVHTDSIFAVVCEELGLVGALGALGLFALFAYRGYRIALETPDPFGSLMAFGATTMIIIEALLNVLVITGMFPFTGTALPFFTYGGTEMLMTLGGVGLILAVSGGHRKGESYEDLERRWRNWWARLSSSRRRAGAASRRA